MGGASSGSDAGAGGGGYGLPTAQCVLLYDFDDASVSGTTMLDRSASGNHATLSGAPASVPGVCSQARAFVAASSQFASTAGADNLKMVDGLYNVSITAHVKTTPGAEAMVFLCMVSNVGWFFSVTASGLVRFFFRVQDTDASNNADITSTTGGALGDGGFHTITATLNRSTKEVCLYVDGALVGSGIGGPGTNTTTTLTFTSAKIATYPGPYFYTVTPDDLAVFRGDATGGALEGILTPAQVQTLSELRVAGVPLRTALGL